MYYFGSKNYSCDAFSGCSALKNVCVPPDYESKSFYGVSATSNTNKCQSFRSLFDSCFWATYTDSGAIIRERRPDADEWENQKTGCMERYCDDELGPVSWSLCNSTEGITRACMNNVCVEVFRTGVCGNNCEWRFYEAGVIVVSGTGEI